MNKNIYTIIKAALLASVPLFATAAGCELISSIDRSQIPETGGSGGTGGSTTSSTGTGGSCPSGTMACTTPTDCPATTSDCVANTCDMNCCGTTNLAAGQACTSNAGTVCDGNGVCVACVMAGDCPASNTACKIPVCNDNTCGANNTAASTACNDNGGKVCDGSGTCVACVMDTDCAPTGTVCATAVCTGNACTANNAAKGTACNDNGGAVCDGNGMCVAMHCNDSVKDADESDIDCGGADCGACADGLTCSVDGDCQSDVCSGNPTTCQVPTCSDATQNGNESDIDCGGTCSSKCSNTMHCGSNSDCQSTHCMGSNPGTCVECIANGDCAPASCTNGQLTTAGTCNGSNSCAAGTTGPCPGDVKCASATACLATCTSDSDCQSANAYCFGGACVAKGGDGAVCSGNNQCANNRCGTTGSGHCCASTCSTTIAACGATDCDTSGACSYPGNTVTPAPLQTPGDCQKIVCNGSGGVSTADDATDIPSASSSACQINPACCGPSPLAPCFTSAPTGTPCSVAGYPPAHVCGNTGGPLAGTCVECNTNADCLAVNDAGTLACDTSTGTCQ